jgi:hypothetical protein
LQHEKAATKAANEDRRLTLARKVKIMPRQQQNRDLAKLQEMLQSGATAGRIEALADRLATSQQVVTEERRARTPKREHTQQTRPGHRRTAQNEIADIAAIQLTLLRRLDDGLAQLGADLRANPDLDWSAIQGLLDRVISNRQRLEILDTLQNERRRVQAATAVFNEPPPYGEDSPHSCYRDVAITRDAAVAPLFTGGDIDSTVNDAQERLARHQRDIGQALQKRNDYGKKIERLLRESTRVEDAELHTRRTRELVKEVRTFATGGGTTASAAGGQAAAFVSPYFLMTAAAPYRGPIRVFADQCASFPMPAYGMRCYIPTFTTTDSASRQTEGGAVSETDPTTGLEGGEVQTVTGQITMTQQLRDRVPFTSGGQWDLLISQELNWRVDEQIDKYTLTQAIASATVVAGQTTYSEANLWKDLATARESLADTAGTRLRATSMFASTDLYGMVTRQVDKTTERPIWPPWYATAFPLVENTDNFQGPNWPQYARYMGTVMPGDVVWLCDDNIPAVGTTTIAQILVAAPAVATVLLEGEPITTPFAETFANELKVVLNYRKYVAVITRHAAGVATIQGEGYKTTEK